MVNEQDALPEPEERPWCESLEGAESDPESRPGKKQRRSPSDPEYPTRYGTPPDRDPADADPESKPADNSADDFRPADDNHSRPPPSPPSLTRRILLANLPYNTTEDDISEFFRDAGADLQRVELVKVNPGNRFNGNAYVWLRDDRSVDIALAQDNRDFLGRMLRISAMPEDQRTACVRGMRLRSTAQDVERLFRGCKILDVRSRPVKGGPPDVNTWFVDFADDESFRAALAKDRSAKGLMICIATAQGPRRNSLTPRNRDKQSGGASTPGSAPPPGRSDDRGPRDDYDGYPPRPDDHDRGKPRDAYEDRDGHERRSRDPHPDRNGYVNGGPASYDRPPVRSRSPPRGYERPDRDRDRDRGYGRDMDRDRDRDRSKDYDRHRDRPRDRDRDRDRDRGEKRDRDYDRDRDRYSRYDRDRYGDYDKYGGRASERNRRFSPPAAADDWHRDRDRYRERDDRRRDYRDYDNRYEQRDRNYRRDRRDSDYGRDYGRRHDRNTGSDRHPDKEVIHHPDKVLDTAMTAVLTNLPFCEERERVIDTLRRTLEEQEDNLKVDEIIPVGRRCGACVVIFQDNVSQSRAVQLQSLMINSRKVNILPLEVPSVARIQKLSPGYSDSEILEDMRHKYGVESVYVRTKQADQMIVVIQDSRFLVRLLDIDGRPLFTSRYATISYIPSRNHAESMSGRGRRPSSDYDDQNGRGNGPPPRDRDERDSPGDRRRSDGRGDRRDEPDHSHKEGDRDGGSYHGSQWQFKINASEGLDHVNVAEAFKKIGASLVDVDCDKEDGIFALVAIKNNDESLTRKVLSLTAKDFKLPSSATGFRIRRMTERKSTDHRNDNHADDESPKKKLKQSPEGKSNSTTIHVSPMTPSPVEHSTGPSVRKGVDTRLPKIIERVTNLRSTIMERGCNEVAISYNDLCNNLANLREPQKLIYSLKKNIDPHPDRIWLGTISKGSSEAAHTAKENIANCVGYVVTRSSQTAAHVQKFQYNLPEHIKIEFRGKWTDEAFEHLLHPKSVAMIVKTAPEESRLGTSKRYSSYEKTRSRSSEMFAGIAYSMQKSQRMGIGRFIRKVDGKDITFMVLCLPPCPHVYEILRIPWRYKDFAGHKSLIVIVGPKYPTTNGIM